MQLSRIRHPKTVIAAVAMTAMVAMVMTAAIVGLLDGRASERRVEYEALADTKVSKLIVTGTGSDSITTAGGVQVAGNVAVNTNKFTIDATTGNAVVAGTLGVTGVTTTGGLLNSGAQKIGGTVTVTGINSTLSDYAPTGIGSAAILDITTTTNVAITGISAGQVSGQVLIVRNNIASAGTLNFIHNSTSATANQISMPAAANWTVRQGSTVTLVYNGARWAATSVSTSAFPSLTVDGAATVGTTLGVTDDFAINTNKFTVAASTGNTAIAGTLAVNGATTLGDADADTTTINGAVSNFRVLSGSTVTTQGIYTSTSGNYNTTSGALDSRGVNSAVTGTRASGANALTNYAFYATAQNAQNNYSFYGAAGTLYNAGNAQIDGTASFTSGTFLYGVSALPSTGLLSWSATTTPSASKDIGLERSAAGELSVTAGTASTTGNLKAFRAAFGGSAIDTTTIVQVASTAANPTGSVVGGNFQITGTQTSNNAQRLVGGSFLTSLGANAFNWTNASGLAGGVFQFQSSNTGTVTKAAATETLLYNVGAGTITNGYGDRVMIQNLNAGGVISDARGVDVNLEFNSGTLTNTYGFRCSDVTSGTQTNQAYCFYAGDVNARNLLAGTNQFGTVQADNTSIWGRITPQGTAPTASVGSVSTGSTNTSGAITGIAATSTVITYATAWPNRSFCTASIATGNDTAHVSTAAGTLTVDCVDNVTGIAANCPNFQYTCTGN